MKRYLHFIEEEVGNVENFMVAATFRLRKEREIIAYKYRIKPTDTNKDKN